MAIFQEARRINADVVVRLFVVERILQTKGTYCRPSVSVCQRVSTGYCRPPCARGAGKVSTAGVKECHVSFRAFARSEGLRKTAS